MPREKLQAKSNEQADTSQPATTYNSNELDGLNSLLHNLALVAAADDLNMVESHTLLTILLLAKSFPRHK